MVENLKLNTTTNNLVELIQILNKIYDQCGNVHVNSGYRNDLSPIVHVFYEDGTLVIGFLED